MHVSAFTFIKKNTCSIPFVDSDKHSAIQSDCPPAKMIQKAPALASRSELSHSSSTLLSARTAFIHLPTSQHFCLSLHRFIPHQL